MRRAAPVRLVAVVALAAATALLVWRGATRRGDAAPAAAPPHRILVAEFDNRTGRADLGLLGSIAQDWISARLIRFGDTTVVDGPTALRLWRVRDGARSIRCT